MIVAGEMLPNKQLNRTINQLARSELVAVFAEPISNLKGEQTIQQIDPLFWRLNSNKNNHHVPDLLISFGGPVVSKHFKIWLQKHPQIIHFRISEAKDNINTYLNLNENIIGDANEILSSLVSIKQCDSSYRKDWEKLQLECNELHHKFVKSVVYSDFKVYKQIAAQIPENSIIHIGNSTPIRYAQLFNLQNASNIYSNRGVSGIDGCVSTAAGYAMLSKYLNILLVGDLSFLYDSNALWNRNFPNNLKIIVVNNQGGGIFSMIPGPDKQPGFESFMQAHHPVDFELLIKAYGIKYSECSEEAELSNSIDQLFQSEVASILVINTPGKLNTQIFKHYVNQFK